MKSFPPGVEMRMNQRHFLRLTDQRLPGQFPAERAERNSGIFIKENLTAEIAENAEAHIKSPFEKGGHRGIYFGVP
jgi:hypothetical protein